MAIVSKKKSLKNTLTVHTNRLLHHSLTLSINISSETINRNGKLSAGYRCRMPCYRKMIVARSYEECVLEPQTIPNVPEQLQFTKCMHL